MSRWKAFFCSMLITLFCLLPLYLLMLGGELFGTQAVDETVSGVPVLTPGEEDRLTLLLVIDDPAPAAVLMRLDAWRQRVELLVLPGDTLLPSEGGRVTLRDCLSETGPLQLRSALAEALGTDTERYLCLSSAALVELFREYSPLMEWEELGNIRDLVLLRRFAFNGGEGVVSSGTAAALVRGNEDGDAAAARLRAALYRAFLAEALPTLAGPAVELLRSDTELLTDISAVDIYGVERLLTLLGQAPPAVSADIPEGIAVREGWQLTDAGWDALRSLLAD